jgi:hypothetical protein
MVQEKGQEQQELGATWHLHAKDKARCGAHGRAQQTLFSKHRIPLACSYHPRHINRAIHLPGTLYLRHEEKWYASAMRPCAAAEMTRNKTEPRRIHDHGKALTMVSEDFTQSPCQMDGSRIFWAPRVCNICIRRQPPGEVARQTAVKMPRRQDPIRRPTRNFLWPSRYEDDSVELRSMRTNLCKRESWSWEE